MMDMSARRLAGVFGPTCPRVNRSLAIGALCWLVTDSSDIHAGEIFNADGFALQWDTTLRYSAGARLTPLNSVLLRNPNADDGDRDFAPGLISNRIDLASVLSLTTDEFGVLVGADGWYDTVYHARTHNNSPGTYNAVSVPNTEFPRATRDLEGQYVELGDAFVYANFPFLKWPLSVRIGRQTVLWGESAFFDQDSIAAAQAPIDYLRNMGPQNYSNSASLPVTQVFISSQPIPDVTVAAYYQFEWRRSRLPAVGSYFSDSDVIGAGSERLLLDNGQFMLRRVDRTPSDGSHFGISLKATLGDIDLGLYALRYASEYPYLKFSLYSAPEPDGEIGEFYSAYPGAIDLYGASISGYIGNSSIVAEVATRVNAPILGGSGVQQYYSLDGGETPSANYVHGKTFHAQIAAISTFGPGTFWDSANLAAQFGSTWLLDVTQNPNAIDYSREKFVSSIRAVFEPHYFEVLPNLDISLPLGIGYGLTGQSNAYFGPVSGAGDFEVGISATYRSVWKADLTFTGFAGSPSRQILADRDFILFSVERSF